MGLSTARDDARNVAINRSQRLFDRPLDVNGAYQKVTDYYAESIFDFRLASGIPDSIKAELEQAISTNGKISKEHADVVAKAVTAWALEKGATHFCHWFQPLTGSTAEKHDAFLDFSKEGLPIEKLSASQLIQGEPDASSFPNGGSRSTFEARGYTAWDLSSPMFLVAGSNGMTLCIPTAFVSYNGEALDIKTPLLRSVSKLNASATKFMNLIGYTDVKNVSITCGAEQEYFLVDKSFYYTRPDLVMTGRTLMGAASSRNQQLDDHYFGAIPERVLAFMEELDFELHKLGIPAKTRHNEVAPGQFELAQIFRDANISADNNQLVMSTIGDIAQRHDFVALLHEKPFAGVNGSGKHLNWSMATDTGLNLLEPGDQIHKNASFLAVTSTVIEAVHRHARVLRASISSQGNDHRLGANEAPPSIISVFTGSTIGSILAAIKDGKEFIPNDDVTLDLGATELAKLPQDNTDRNRTSPFAFTGNKFEFRAVGSTHAIGFPLTVLNGAVAQVLDESNEFLEREINSGTSVDKALIKLTQKWMSSSWDIIFNGDGYSSDWVEEAKNRGLPNLKTTADALPVLVNQDDTSFLTQQEIYRSSELETRYNVLIERYCTLREIEFHTMIDMVHKYVVPCALKYKKELAEVLMVQKELKIESRVELEIFQKLNILIDSAYEDCRNLSNMIKGLSDDESLRSKDIADKLMPVSEQIAGYCAQIESIVPDCSWPLPTYFDMLFLR